MPRLGQVDANLVRAARFEPAGHERVVVAKVLDRLDVGDGPLALLSARRATAAVAPVADEIRDDRA
jgi:hypothetical protein